MARTTQHEIQRLRSLAAWYRDFAEKTNTTYIWEARLRTAETLEKEADKLERGFTPPSTTVPSAHN